MTTPAGYYDENGNFIPGSFADQLDLPDSNIDTSGAAKQQSTANAKKLEAAKAMSAYSKQKKVAASAMAAYRKKGATAAQKAAATRARNAALKDMKKQTMTRNAALTAQNTAQNKAYELSGQYEKLLSGQNRDAYAALRSMFNQYGLGSLAGKIYDYAKKGYGADVISLLLQNTTEYKTRFAGNETRAKQGLPVLSPAEYLATEQAYRQVLQDAGLPKGFYDSPTDFTNWISKDISPTEIKGRVDIAVAKTMGADDATKQALKQLYGVDDSYIVAWALDEKKALPLLQKQATAASYGAEALKRGLEMNGQNLEDFVNAGLSLSQVSSGFQAVAEALPNIQAIASRYGESINQSELEQDLVAGVSGTGQNKRKRLASQERALFSGFGGSTPAGLSTGYQPT